MGSRSRDRPGRHARTRSRARLLREREADRRAPTAAEPVRPEGRAARRCRRADAAHGVPRPHRLRGARLTTPIPFVRDLDIEYGRVDQVSPLIRRVVAHNPSKFTYLGTGTYIVGHGDVAVIDPGPDMAAHVDAIVDALEPGERVAKIVITHTH